MISLPSSVEDKEFNALINPELENSPCFMLDILPLVRVLLYVEYQSAA